MVNAILSWAVFAGFCVGIVSTIRNGEIRQMHGRAVIKRADAPGAYWFWTCIFLATTSISFLGALYFTFAR